MSTTADLREIVKTMTTDYDGRVMHDDEEVIGTVHCSLLRSMMARIEYLELQVEYMMAYPKEEW